MLDLIKTLEKSNNIINSLKHAPSRNKFLEFIRQLASLNADYQQASESIVKETLITQANAWVQAEINDVQKAIEPYSNYNDRQILLKYLDEIQSCIYVKPTLKVLSPCDRWQEHAVRIEQEYLNKNNLFKTTLSNIKNRAEKNKDAFFYRPKCFISYAWPLLDNSHEYWVQNFLKNLALHLELAGIQVELDILYSRWGNNAIEFMTKIENSHYTLLIGTESLLTKSNQGTSLIANELTHLLDRHKQWMNTSSAEVDKSYASVIPLLLTGTYESSFPKYYRNHRVIEGFISCGTPDAYRKSYLTTFKELLNNLYRTRAGFQDLWEPIFNLHDNMQGLPKASVLNYIAKEEKEIHKKMQQFTQECDQLLEQHLKEITNKPQLSVHKWNLPSLTYFIGRDKEILQLEEAFKEDTTFIITCQQEEKHTQALTGMAGIGKTKLAIAFAHRAAITLSYKVIAWFDAGTNLSQNLRDFCQQVLKIDTLDKSEETLIQEMYQANQNKFLLIFDDVSNYSDFAKYLPNTKVNNFDILITSRSQHWGTLNKLALHVFTHDEAVAYVQGILKNEPIGNCQTLASKLGYLPLALAQAVAYIQQCGTNIQNYLLTFEAHTKELLDSPTFPNDPYKQTVLTVMSLTVSALSSKNKNCLPFLYSCSLLNNIAIPRELLKNSLSCDDFHLDSIVKILLEYSLIEIDTNTNINIHPLVQEILMLLSSITDRNTAATKLWTCIRNNIPLSLTDDFSQYPLFTLCRPHGIALFYSLKKLNLLNENVIKLQHDLVEYISRLDLNHGPAYQFFKEIRELNLNLSPDFQIILSIAEARYHSLMNDSQQAIVKLSSLANVTGLSPSQLSLLYYEKMRIHIGMNEKVEAENCFNKIKEIEDKIGIINLPTALHTMSLSKFDEGKYLEAIEMLNLALVEKIKIYRTTKHQQIAITHSFLGEVYSIIGDNTNALAHLNAAKEIYHHSYNGKLPFNSIIITDYRLAEALYRGYNFIEAKIILEKILADVAQTGNKYLLKGIPVNFTYLKVLYQLGNYQKSKSLLTDYLAEAKDNTTIFILNLNLGKILSIEGNYELALAKLNDAEQHLLLTSKNLENHNGARLQFFRAEILYLQNQFGLADSLLKEIIKIQIQAYNNKNHSFLAESYLCLAKVYFKQKNYTLCTENINKALQMQSALSCIPDDPLISEIQREQAKIFCINNKISEALEMIKKVLEKQVRAYQTDNHIEIALTKFTYALILEKNHKYDLAKQKKQEALNIFSAIGMPTHPLIVDIKHSLENSTQGRNNLESNCHRFWKNRNNIIIMATASIVGTAAVIYNSKYHN